MKSDAQNTDAQSDKSIKKIAIGDVVEIDIKDVAHGGHFVAHHQNQVIFVRHAITGERVKAKITHANNKILLADTVEVILPSKHRVKPKCKYLSDTAERKCGGCDYQHIDIEYQRQLKKQVVEDQFYRLAKFDLKNFKGIDSTPFDLVQVDPKDGWNWRTRMNFAVTVAGKMGMFPHHSNKPIEISECQIADERLKISEFAKRNWSGKSKVSLELVADSEVSVKLSHGEDVGIFWQSHINAQEVLTDYIRDKVKISAGAKILDLYSGVGVFAQFVLSIQPALSALSLVDTSPESIKFAKQNISNLIGKNSAIKFEAHAVEVLKYLRNQVNENRSWDLAIVDPPRSGLNQQIIELLAKLKLAELVYISCDPASLARDFSNLVKSGYRLNHIKSFDLFPMTQHIETVAIFSSVLR